MRRTMRRTWIAAASVMIAAGLIDAVVTPASAEKPIPVIEPPDDGGDDGYPVIPAGEGCSFDVEIQFLENENAKSEAITEFEFSDGRVGGHDGGEANLVNLETGDSFHQKSSYQLIETYDPVANEIVVEIDGQFLINFWRGDQVGQALEGVEGLPVSPSGVVQKPGLLLSVDGDQRLTIDPDTGFSTSYSLDGRATDICAALSG